VRLDQLENIGEFFRGCLISTRILSFLLVGFQFLPGFLDNKQIAAIDSSVPLARYDVFLVALALSQVISYY
jgi:hypothetical protein